MSQPRELGRLVIPDQTGVKPVEILFPKDKVIADLRQGYRVSITDMGLISEGWVRVITRFGEDYFSVDADSGSLGGDGFQKSFSRFDVTIRRRKKPGSATLERWRLSGTTDRPMEEDYRIQMEKGGELSKKDFLARYDRSAFDHKATAELFEGEKEDLARGKYGARGRSVSVHWIHEEEPSAPLFPKPSTSRE